MLKTRFTIAAVPGNARTISPKPPSPTGPTLRTRLMLAAVPGNAMVDDIPDKPPSGTLGGSSGTIILLYYKMMQGTTSGI